MIIILKKLNRLNFFNRKLIIFSVFVVFGLFFSHTAFAVWDGQPYSPGETYNPECLPSTPLCDVLPSVTTDQTTSQTIGDITNRLFKLWATDITVTNAIAGSVTGNAGTVSGLTITAGASISNSNTGDQTLAGLGGVAANVAIAGATKTKITYDSKGLVTSGADATTADIAASTDKNYVTDAQLTVIGNTSNTNSGDNATNSQYSGLVTNATHSGDATGSGALTVVGINNTILSTLGTGLLKNTTGTGVPSIAIGSDLDATFGSQTANYVYAAPNGIAGNPSFRALVATDIPALSYVVPNVAIVGATKTKITYDSKGLVTSGADATTADIAASTDKNYVTDAQLTVIGNTSNTNSGDNATNSQYSGLVTNATHSGDATGSGALTVVGINNTILSTLGTGLLKNTTGTGVPSIAVSGTDVKTINSQSLLGSGNITVATLIGYTPEQVLTFSSGLTRATNTVTNNLITGLAGGQTVIGGTGASENLTLSSTSNATKGKILFGTSAYDEANNRLGIGNASPTVALELGTTTTGQNQIINATVGAEMFTSFLRTNWTLGTAWDATNSNDTQLNKNAAFTTTAVLNTVAPVIGTTYKVVITVNAITVAGGATYNFGGVLGRPLNQATTYTEYITAVTTGGLIFTPASTATRFTINAISIIPITNATTGTLVVNGNSSFIGPIVNPVVINKNGINGDVVNGLTLSNNTAATATVFQNSPSLTLQGNAWDTTNSVSNPVRWDIFTLPGTSGGGGSNTLVFRSSGGAGGTFSALSINGYTGLVQAGGPISATGLITAGSGSFSDYQTMTTTSTDGLVNYPSSAALVGTPVRMSPRIRLTGYAWNTTPTAASNSINFIEEVLPVSGATTSGSLNWSFDNNGGGYSEKMRLTSGGNLGIGVAPSVKLHLFTTADVDTEQLRLEVKPSTINHNGSPSINFWGGLPGGGNTTSYNEGKIYTKFDGNTYPDARLTLTTASGAGTWIDGLTVKNGLVGIGTVTSPTAKLYVAATPGANGGINLALQTDPGTGSAYTSIDFNVPVGGLTGQFFATAPNYVVGTSNLYGNSIGLVAEHASGQLLLGAIGANGFISFDTGGVLVANERMRIIKTGQIGMGGVIAPTAWLHLGAGTATASQAPLKFTSGTLLGTAEAGAVEFVTDDFYATITTGAARKGIVLNDGTKLTSTRVPFATTNGRLTDSAAMTFNGTKLTVGATAVDGTTLLTLTDIDSSCNFTANAGAPSCGSDLTLKKNINDQTDNLNKVLALRPVTYNWLTDADGADAKHGFIAQEVATVMPELVTDGTWIDGSTRKFLQTAGMIPYMVGAIKELDLKLESVADINTPLIDETGTETFAGLFFDRMKAWLGDVGNGIEEIFTKKIHTEQVCVKKSDGTEICIDGDQLQNIVDETGTPIPDPTPVPPPTPDPTPTCSDGIQNQDETGIDTGGVCGDPTPPPAETCSDGIQNQDETGIDTGGVCGDPVPLP